MKEPIAIREKNETYESLLKDLSNKQCLPLGPSSSFLFHLDQLYFLEWEKNPFLFFPSDPLEWNGKSVFFLFDKFADPSHLRGARMLFIKGMEMLKKDVSNNTSFQLTLDLSGQTIGLKHVLLQFGKIEAEQISDPLLGFGRLIDIHHISKGGGPSLSVLKNNRLEFKSSADTDIESPAQSYSLTPREMEVLKLKSEGLGTREISLILRRSPLTVYSVVRDIKKKTGMEIIPLIKILFENGKLK